jgi:hypothetical protein
MPPTDPLDRRTRAGVAALTVAAFVAATCAPLATYATTLAVFGLAHVVAELRYVDLRFGPRLAGRVRMGVLVLLVAVMGARLLQVRKLVPREAGIALELCLVVLLVVAVAPLLWQGRRSALWLGVAVAGAIAVGASTAPLHTLLALAVLHNLTPLGFLADALPPERRARDLAWAGALFVGGPLLVATGLPGQLLPVAPDWAPAAIGPLRDHLGAYLWPEAAAGERAVDLFSACVFAQCLHYVAVIVVLPRFAPDAGRGVAPWPRARVLGAGAVVASALLSAAWVASFTDARAGYGVIAAVHAWLEVPILLLALAGSS